MYPANLSDIQSPAVRARVAVERQIVRSLVREFLTQRFQLVVDDGEELHRASTEKQAMKALLNTDEDILIVYGATSERIGAVQLVYGNDGWDVMSDWSVALDPYMPKTLALVAKFS